MKIIEAIKAVDTNVPNGYEQREKIKWLSTLDGMIKIEVIDTHEGAEDCTFVGYDGNTDIYETELLAPSPYDFLYLRWMEAQIHYNNCENEKYNNAIDVFNTFYEEFKRYYNRMHMPKGERVRFF